MAKRKSCFVSEVGEPLDALSTNRERSRVAVMGRTVTKIYAILEDRFEIRTEKSKPRTTMCFSGSIAWSPLKDNLIAAASSNGYVYLWDPDSPHSTERSYRAHRQLTTKVCFNEFNENLLVSGSKDSTVWLYDLRSPEPTTCFASNRDDSIRDIQFCMESKLQDTFVTAGDSGTIQFWDARRPDRALKKFKAHISQVYSIALNPQSQSKNLIATAGKDKYIRIWDWSKNTPDFIYAVEMMAIVTRVSWCPDNSWHVACCIAPPSGFVSSDNTIYVWDIRRPFIPYASFDAHKKTCTDMSWSRFGNDDNFLSCGKDGKLIMNFMENAHRPILYANTVALDAKSPEDSIVVAVPSDRRKTSASADPFRRKVPSMLFCAVPTDPLLMTAQTTAYFAENYKLVGGSVEELCDHNARVAERIYRDRLAYTWRMLALLCSQTELGTVRPELSSTGSKPKNAGASANANEHLHFKRSISSNYLLGNEHPKGNSHHRHPYNHRSRILHGSGHSADERPPVGIPDTEFSPSSVPAAVLISGSLSAVAHQQNADGGAFSGSDLFFGADELNLGGIMDFGNFGGDDPQQLRRGEMHSSRRSIVCSSVVDLSQLKEEAFELRPYGNAVGRKMTTESSRSLQRQAGRKRTTDRGRRRKKTGNVFDGGNVPDLDAFETQFGMEEDQQFKAEQHRGRVEDELVMSNNGDSAENGSCSSLTPSSSSDSTNHDRRNDYKDEADIEEVDEEEEGSVDDGDEEEEEEEEDMEQMIDELDDAAQQDIDQSIQNLGTSSLLHFDPMPSLRSLLDYYSNLGDVQMCASICMVIGERIVDSGLVNVAQAELWFLGYLELLERLRLWRAAALLIKSNFRPKISQLSNESTFMKVWCPQCKNTALRASPRCKSCRRLYDYKCCICETPVRGLWTCCNGCGHGGHVAHLQDWFAEWDRCPAPGCEHFCAYGQRQKTQQQQQRLRHSRSPMTTNI